MVDVRSVKEGSSNCSRMDHLLSLSNKESNFILSSLEVGHLVAQTQPFVEPIQQILIDIFLIVYYRYQIYNNMMNMIIYTCNISNSCKTNNTILFKLKCIKKSPKIWPLPSMNPHQEAGVATPPHLWVCPTPPQIMAWTHHPPQPLRKITEVTGVPLQEARPRVAVIKRLEHEKVVPTVTRTSMKWA